MSRKVLILIAIPLLLIIAAAILVTLLLDEEKVVAIASDVLREQTGAILQVDGEMHLALFPTIGVALSDASLRMPEGRGDDITVKSLDIGVQLIPLLSGRVEIDSIDLDGLLARLTSGGQEEPRVDTSGMSDAELEAFYAARRKAIEEAGQAAQGQEVLAVPLALNVGKLSITNSRLELRDADTGEITAVNLERVLAQNLNLDGRPIPLEVRLTLEGEKPVDLGFDGSVIVAQHLQLVTLDSAALEVSGATPEPLQLEITGPVRIADQVADLQVVILQGDTRGEGMVRYAGFESPQITTTLRVNVLNPALLVLAGPEAAAQGEAEPVGKDGGEPAPGAGDEPLPLDALRAIDTRADLAVGRAELGAHTVEDLKIALRAVEGDIRVTHLTGKLHGGDLDMTASFNARLTNAKLDTRGGLAGLDVATALAALDSKPVMTGRASLDWSLQGNGRTANELVRSLSGPVTLSTEQVVLKDMALERLFCQAVALVNKEVLQRQFPADSALQALSADVQLGDGKARLDPLRVELPGASLRGKGNIDLLSQDFKAKFNARVSPQLGELDPACRVDERYTDIDWPVECRGNVAGDPADWCAVDTADIIEQLAKGEVKRKVEKEAGKFLDKLFK